MAKSKSVKRKPNPPSALEVVDIPVELLIPDPDNPNVMDEETFDLLVEEIQTQGFDEPIQVRQHPTKKDCYQIGGGHHRVKAATIAGLTSVPAVIKNWTDREQKVALAKRNALRGEFNKTKLLGLYRDLVKDKDPSLVQRELGFTNKKKFELLIDDAKKNMSPKQKKQLDKAKESIKSIDDLSSVLNRIFKESGSELDDGYMVFSFGGKQHHYFQIDDATNKKLGELIKACDAGDVPYKDLMQSIISRFDGQLPSGKKSVNKKKKRKIRKKK